MTRIVVRRVTADDKEEWLRMRLALWPETISEEHLSEMDATFEGALTPVFVAERTGGGLGGFLEAATRSYADGCTTRPVGYIEGWYVDEDLRRQGVGGLLVQAAEEWARTCGLKEMASDTWLDNEASIKAHLALGYEEADRLVVFCKTL
jgi:aminoglycoside 6'-N-acetyltransferase I